MAPLLVFLAFVFVVGASVGSFLNVAVARLPYEKSLIWPGSRCSSCFKPVRWYDNLPILSYLLLRGRCRQCGVGFSIQYLLVELATGLAFVGLFYLEVVMNIQRWPVRNPWLVQVGLFPMHFWIGFIWHATLLSFLMAASVCDLNGREIPFSLTLTGTLIGLLFSPLLAWPWPWMPAEATPQTIGGMPISYAWLLPERGMKTGLYPWPFWGPLPAGFAPGGNWQTGLATALAGMLVGTFMLRAAGYLFSKGLGKEALGLGDADLMMMAGAFLGWQPIVVAFFLGSLLALPVALLQWLVRRDNSLPFGPSLSLGVLLTALCWRWIGPAVQPLMFFGELMLGLTLASAAVMFVSSLLLRVLRGARAASGQAKP